MAEEDAVFGGEHSGHYYFRDFWFADTGMLAALHVLAAAGATTDPLSSLVEQYSLFAASGEINSTVAEVEPILHELEERFAGRATPDRVDGLTLTGDGWWVNVRPSNTEPLLRLNVEAPTSVPPPDATANVTGAFGTARPLASRTNTEGGTATAVPITADCRLPVLMEIEAGGPAVRGVAVARNVAEIADVAGRTVATNALPPICAPSTHEPSVAIPDAFVTADAPVMLPPPD